MRAKGTCKGYSLYVNLDYWGELCESEAVNPTVFSVGSYRFFFFSKEESRPHVHVISSKGEAKFWIEPTISLAAYDGLKAHELKKLQRIVENRIDEIKEAWKEHFEM